MNKKGFTLIELLAVIVVLAIIAVIAVPQILGVIEKVKIGSAENSALGYIDGVEKYKVMHEVNSAEYPLDLQSGKTYQVADITGVKVKGKAPSYGVIEMGDNGEVDGAMLRIGNYNVCCIGNKCSAKGECNFKVYNADSTCEYNCDDNNDGICDRNCPPDNTDTNSEYDSNICPSTTKNCVIYNKNKICESTELCGGNSNNDVAVKGPTKINAKSGETHKGIVYLDPTDLTKACTRRDVEANVSRNGTPTGVKTGCMKWYIFDDTGDNYTMILDHNTTPRVAWDNNNYVSYEDSQLKLLLDDLVLTSGWRVAPRLITGSEITTITNNTNFDFTDSWAQYSIGANYSWLYDYLYSSVDNDGRITDVNFYIGYGKPIGASGYGDEDIGHFNEGYWTSTDIQPYYAFYVGSGLFRSEHKDTSDNGIRPVISIEKSLVEESNDIASDDSNVSIPNGETHKGIVYLDPTDLTRTCTESDASSNVGSNGSSTEVKTGCMKWYVYDDSGDNYTMILDHNAAARIEWKYDFEHSNVDVESSEIKQVLDDLVDYDGWQVTPRLISANEIKTITNNSSFDLTTEGYYYFGSKNAIRNYSRQTAKEKNIQEKYYWLFDNLYESANNGGTTSDNESYSYYSINYGGDITRGYWTSTPIGTAGSGSSIWIVGGTGRLYYDSARYEYGVRPVITIPKTSVSIN